jgi:hypothetical protein
MAAASPAVMSRASFLACLRSDSRDGREGRNFEAVIATSFHESPAPIPAANWISGRPEPRLQDSGGTGLRFLHPSLKGALGGVMDHSLLGSGFLVLLQFAGSF